ncbi:MAG: glycerol-3-phosphate 1-O-acyltransferase PlsY [Verrucomicrobia bacterium]|nr:glycerol-3-phosphate 1-O-acyltransferase PlsY [Cytophagales bacterium]
MDIFLIILGGIFAYLIGSIPTSVWYGKAYFGIDIRDYGSGNAGATNTFRVLGKRAGTVVMLVDVLKGATATLLAMFLYYLDIVSFPNIVFYKLAYGILAIVGHIFPIYENFKGGKGVAALLGMTLAIHIWVALICIGVFLIVLLASRYVSLGSMLATLTFPLLSLTPRFSPDEPIVIVFGFTMFLLVILTHQKNIIRMLNGEENKTYLRLRKR